MAIPTIEYNGLLRYLEQKLILCEIVKYMKSSAINKRSTRACILCEILQRGGVRERWEFTIFVRGTVKYLCRKIKSYFRLNNKKRFFNIYHATSAFCQVVLDQLRFRFLSILLSIDKNPNAYMCALSNRREIYPSSASRSFPQSVRRRETRVKTLCFSISAWLFERLRVEQRNLMPYFL